MQRMPAFARRAMRAWLARFSVTPRLDLESVVREAAKRHGRTQSFSQSRFDYSALARIGAKLVLSSKQCWIAQLAIGPRSSLSAA